MISPVERCRRYVYRNRGLIRRRCERAPIRDGYCPTHHPDAEKRREAKRAEALARFDRYGIAGTRELARARQLLAKVRRFLAPSLRNEVDQFLRESA